MIEENRTEKGQKVSETSVSQKHRMSETDTIGARIQKSYKTIDGKVTKEHFADSLGVSTRTLQRYTNNERQPDSDFMRLLCSEYGVSPHWLLFGEGEMLMEQLKQVPQHQQAKTDVALAALGDEQAQQRGEQRQGNVFSALKESGQWFKNTVDEIGVNLGAPMHEALKTLIISSELKDQPSNFRPLVKAALQDLFDQQDLVQVPVYDEEASIGHGAVIEQGQQVSQLAFKKTWLQERGLNKDSLAVIKARGDSMEPTVFDKDILLIDTRINKVTDDNIYIIRYKGYLSVKRIRNNFDGSVKIISDNTRYGDQDIPKEQAEQITISGRAVWIGHEI